jgi:hypothetical protein
MKYETVRNWDGGIPDSNRCLIMNYARGMKIKKMEILGTGLFQELSERKCYGSNSGDIKVTGGGSECVTLYFILNTSRLPVNN